MKAAVNASPDWATRLVMRTYPRAFRERHGRDLLELYRDFSGAGRPLGRLGSLWDMFRGGISTRLDELRGSHDPGTPGTPPPEKRNLSMDTLWHDIRFAFRMLVKRPAFTAVAVISLAVGIAANTTVFGLTDAALLRPLAVSNPHELVVLGWISPVGTEMPDISTWGWYLNDDDGNGLGSSYSVNAFEAFGEQRDTLASTFAFANISQVNLTTSEDAQLTSAQMVSGNYYATLGVQPALGRLIVAADDRRDADAVAVISYGLWQRRFGGDVDVVGRDVRVNGEPFQIIGVAPEGFRGTGQASDNPEITLPLNMQPRVATGSRDMWLPGNWWLHVMGRLAPGVEAATAQERLDAAFQASVQADLFPDGVPAEYTLPHVDVRPGFQGMTEQRGIMRLPLAIMSGVVALVLLIACVNVANLSMARAGSRRQEIAIRQSMGAGRWRLIRQLFAESMVMACISGAVGIGLAVWGREAMIAAMSTRELYVSGVQTDWRVLAFGILVTVATSVVFGLLPAVRVSRSELTPAMKEARGERRHGLWGVRSLLVTQVAMSMLLLVVAGLFVRSLMNLEGEATGFDPRGVAITRLDPRLNGYEGPRLIGLYEDLQRRLKTIPGVEAATVTAHSPVSNRISMTTLKVSGYAPAEDESMRVYYNLVAPEFFDTFGIPVLAGRGIDEGDRDGAAMVAVVNQHFAERFFPGESPIGRRLGLGAESDPGEYRIVGVVEDVKYQQLGDEQFVVAHIAVAQHASSLSAMTLAVRTSGDLGDAMNATRQVVREVDANVPLFDTRTLGEQLATTLEIQRFFARMSLILGGLALGLACVGLYGILSYNVVRQTREIGVRMALGARTAHVLRMVMAELRSVVVGVALGAVAAYGLTRYLESLLYELSPNDPVTVAAATGLLLLVAGIAAYLPARRASSVDPVVALRAE